MIGDKRELTSELERLAPGLRRYARALVACDAADPAREADSLTHDALLRAERAGRAQNARLWLYATLTALNRARARTPGANAPHAPASRQAGGQGVTEALSAIPLDQREPFLLVVLEGFSYAEAADALGISRAAIGARVARARAILDEHLESARQPKTAAAVRRKSAAPHLRLVK